MREMARSKCRKGEELIGRGGNEVEVKVETRD